MTEETWEEPSVPRGRYVSWMFESPCGYYADAGAAPSSGRATLEVRHRVRPDFEMDSVMGYNHEKMKMSHSIDSLTDCIDNASCVYSQLHDMLACVWLAMSEQDPSTPSYVRVAVELKHALANLINAIDGVVAWITGGCTVIPVYFNKPCATFEQWASEAFGDMGLMQAAPMWYALDEIRTLSNHINEHVPYIYLAMQHVREEHGNDVAYLMSPQQSERLTHIEAWNGSHTWSRSLDHLRRWLGLIGHRTPVLWALQHMMHYLSETIELMTNGTTGTLRREREDV